MSTLTALCDATLFTGEAMVEGHAVLLHESRIVDLVANRHVPADARKIACKELILAPGLIDAQVNGGGNVLLNNQPTAEACLAIAKAHRAHGTTSLLLTCISDTPEVTGQAIAAVREARATDAGILGIHIEGPHLGMEKRGVHRAEAIRPVSPGDMALYQRKSDEIVLITLAPETVATADIRTLAKTAIISIGHTHASPEQVRAALQAGATGFTHLYNGMGGMSARSPGVVGTALDDADSWCGLIADGHHVVPEMIRLALHAKMVGKVFLVSDAMAPAATDNPLPFKLYGEEIQVLFPSRLVDNVTSPPPSSPASGRGAFPKCITKTGNLAGSAITLLDAVRYCVQQVGVELDEALRMASTYPAAFLGVDQKLGKLLPGYAANIIALDTDLALRNVWA